MSERVIIAGHEARFDAGLLSPWTMWSRALELEMHFYRQCPLSDGYPRFVSETFLDVDWQPNTARTDTIPATQNGMGILSYLKYAQLRSEASFLHTARSMGDYLIRETLSPDTGQYPSFTRSTGRRGQFPQAADCGSQSDRPYELEPDKGALAGYALLRLFDATSQRRYLQQALHNARILAAAQIAGGAQSSPWPFRVDYRSGEGRGAISGNTVFALRLFDSLSAHGYAEFSAARDSLWAFIKGHQLPSAAGDGALFAQFFEDHDTPTNRSAWAPLNLARYLLEGREQLDVDWREDCRILIEFVRRNFTHQEFGITLCHEQDEDREAWGGVNSSYGAVLALYAKATASHDLAREAYQALNFTLYSIDAQGRPRDLAKSQAPGGWQEDAHTDVIHNYVDALQAYPEWDEFSPA